MTPHINVHGKQAWLTGRFRLFPASLSLQNANSTLKCPKRLGKKGTIACFDRICWQYGSGKDVITIVAVVAVVAHP